MATVRELIQDSLELLGEMGVGEPMSAEDGAKGLLRLNSMLASWSTRRLFIYNITIAVFTLVANDADYTIGPSGADFTAARPLRIDSACILLTVSGNDLKVKDLDLLTQGEYVELSDKAASAVIPEKLYIDNGFPNATLYLFPRPSGSATKIQLSTWTPLSQFAALGDSYSFPPGYYEAISFNLAIQLGPSYNRRPDEALAAKALEAMNAIQNLNRIVGMADMNTQPMSGQQPSAGTGGAI